jgi:hypothetical protein
MSDTVFHARVPTGQQDVAGRALRREQASAIKVFTDLRLGRSIL